MRPIDAEVLENEILLRVPLTESQVNSIKFVINKAPTIKAKPVVHAHWIEKHSLHHICSECHHDAPYKMNGYDAMEDLSDYCPKCGAQMDEKGK